MKILLTGKHGQVGFELQRSLAPLGEIVAVDLAECDLSDLAAIRQLYVDLRYGPLPTDSDLRRLKHLVNRLRP